MTVDAVPLGPGTISIGDVGGEVDFSCQITEARLVPTVNADDPVPTMCGDQVAGSRTYTFALSGTLFQDLTLPDGIVAYSWQNFGTEVPFTFTPNTEAGTTATGILIVDPLEVGGGPAPDKLTSDFEWTIIGTPTVTFGPPAPLADAQGRELVGA